MEVLDLIGNIYDSAIQPDRWVNTLEHIAKYVGGINCALTMHDPVNKKVRLFYDWGTEGKFAKLYIDKYVGLNPLLTSGWFVPLDQPIHVIEYLGEDGWFNSKFYKEWCAPQGWCDGAGVHLAKTVNRYAVISISRSHEQGRFTKASLTRFGELGPHIRRAVTIADMLDARALQSDMMSATLDLLTTGIILTDQKSRIVHANRAGLRLLEENDAIGRNGDHLTAHDPTATGELTNAINLAAAGDSMHLQQSGIAVPIRRNGRGDLAAWVLPLDRGLRNELAAPFAATVAVFIRELGDTSPFPGELFVRRYGITPAECRLLMILVQGMTIREATDALGISQATAKTHLQKLFTKTSTKRQSDLMRLAMTALAPAAS